MISIALAIHNEALNLVSCLEAVAAFADEIVIVDGESTDDSIKIAKKYQAKIISTTNKSNFHINKQMAIDHCSGQLILQLDADEIVDEELAKSILNLHQYLQAQKFIPNSGDPVAWWIKRKNWFLGKFLTKGGQYPDKVIRLFVASKAMLPAHDVHEQMQVSGAIGEISGHLLHYSNPDYSTYLRKMNTYTSFTAEKLYEQKFEISWWHTWQYCIWRPLATTIWMFVRHRGYVDGWAGLIFAIGSGLHFPVAYLKLWEKYESNRHH